MLNQAYNHALIEKKWQDIWLEEKVFSSEYKQSDAGVKPKYYALVMLPYPSGKIHMGHVSNYTKGDLVARFKIASGYNVLHPMGWDAFGLPAENAAIQNNVHPMVWTKDNITTMKSQLMKLGFAYDWDREISTCYHEYYKHEQEIFLTFLEKGLAYRKEAVVNWDPVDNSVLANEQVIDGCGWRSGAKVERRKMKQWFLKITDYADDLLKDLDMLSGWQENVKKMQRDWIGKSNGVIVSFSISDYGVTWLNHDITEIKGIGSIEVFSTRVDTIFGASFIAVAYDHPIVELLAKKDSRISAFCQDCSDAENTHKELASDNMLGIDLDILVSHPLDPNIKLKVYATNFVIMEYGTGAVFGCPAHDIRDFSFARKYNLSVNVVIRPNGSDEKDFNLPFTDDGIVVNSSFLTGLSSAEARKIVAAKLSEIGKGGDKVTYRMRDWVISRQRYWGCPIPVVHCSNCGVIPVNRADLPIVLPEDATFDKSGNPLDHHPTWKHVKCYKCGIDAVRETDTFDTFIESSWYFMRYCSPNSRYFADLKEAEYWLPVDKYIGGIEHAVLHLLYARFFVKAMRDCGYINLNEPFTTLLTQGMVLNNTYRDEETKEWLPFDDVRQVSSDKFISKLTGNPVESLGVEKMSKSKKNGVDPDDVIEEFGADAVRIFILSDSPAEKDFIWNVQGVKGANKFLGKLYNFCIELKNVIDTNHIFEVASDAFMNSHKCSSLNYLMHQTVYGVTKDFENSCYNTAIAKIRTLFNALLDCNFQGDVGNGKFYEKVFSVVLQLLNPITPHITEEMWAILGHTSYLSKTPWPSYDERFLHNDAINIAVQINGKTRAVVEIERDLEKEEVEKIVMKIDKIKEFVKSDFYKVVFVKNRIINIVI